MKKRISRESAGGGDDAAGFVDLFGAPDAVPAAIEQKAPHAKAGHGKKGAVTAAANHWHRKAHGKKK